MRRTLTVVVEILVIAGTLSTGAHAQSDQENGRWCAYFTGGPTNCGFATFEQCIAAIKGKTGLCNQNYAPSAEPAPSAGNRHRRPHRGHDD
ncbi:MAG: DUF3551 domain-containing protein [Xanthobacteraceae bacterium]